MKTLIIASLGLMLAYSGYAEESATTLGHDVIGDWIAGQTQSITAISFSTNGTVHWTTSDTRQTNDYSGVYHLRDATNAAGNPTHYISIAESIVASRGLLLENVVVRLDQRFHADIIGPVLIAKYAKESLVFIRKK